MSTSQDWLGSLTYPSSLDQLPVILSPGPPDKLDTNDEEEDAKDGAGEHPLRADVPRREEEAGVDGVPVPEHRD